LTFSCKINVIDSNNQLSLSVRYFLALLTLILTFQVKAGISLSQAIVHFEDDGKRSEDVVVLNQGSETVYVRVEPSVIRNPGSQDESRELYRDPKAAGLLVTPQRLVIPAGGRKRLRLVRMDNVSLAKEDKVFRVLVKPEVGEVKSDQTAVKIIVAYEILVLSQPKNAKHQLISSFDGKTLKLTNNGNTNVLLQKGNQCPKGQSIEDEKNDCVELTGKRIYAGTSWETQVPFLTPVNYQLSVGMDNDLIVFEREQKNKK
jgi:Mat/Ecp fimbriae periplasmic chaperone